MILSYHKDSINNISINKDSRGDDFLEVLFGTFSYMKTTKRKFVVGASLFANLFKRIFSVVGWLILLPFRLTLVMVAISIYLPLAIAIKLYLSSKIRSAKKIVAEYQKMITNGIISQEKLVEHHKISKAALDKLHTKLASLEGEPIVKPSIDTLVDCVKQIEFLSRKAAYPDRNEIDLTYDELKQLNELTDLTF